MVKTVFPTDEEIMHRLTLDLDISKKRAFNQYLDNVGFLNTDLIKRSNELGERLHEILIDSIERIYKEKDVWIKKIESLNLSDEDHKKEMDRMHKRINLAEQQVEEKIELLMKMHNETLIAVLQLLKDTAISGHSATK